MLLVIFARSGGRDGDDTGPNVIVQVVTRPAPEQDIDAPHPNLPPGWAGYCSTDTSAGWAGEIPPRPPDGYQSAKSSSVIRPSSRCRTHIAVVPRMLLARAIRSVRGGTVRPCTAPTAIAAPRPPKPPQIGRAHV